MTATFICILVSLLVGLPFYPAIVARFVSGREVGQAKFMLGALLGMAFFIFIFLRLGVYLVQLVF
jgi:hypothetical protein